jgi:hypothetical protein
MSQSRKMSFVESAVNIAIGYIVAITAQIVIFPIYGIHADTSTHLQIGMLFTFVSLARSYFLRRLFNAIS